MRLLLVHNKYRSDHVGGKDVVFANEVSALRERLGTENVLIYTVSNDDLRSLPMILGFLGLGRHPRAIARLVRQHRVDVVHVHNEFPLLTPHVFRAARRAGAKVVQTLHNYRRWCIAGPFYLRGVGVCELCVEKRSRLPGVIHACFRASYIQSVVAACAQKWFDILRLRDDLDKIIVLSPFQYNAVRRLGLPEEKLALKGNFVPAMTEKDNQTHPARKDYDFVLVGRIEEEKGAFLVLEAWKRRELPYSLAIVGSPGLGSESHLEGLPPTVKVLGKKSNVETRAIISRSRFLLQTSLAYETFGLTMLEAMSGGVPVVGFSIGTRTSFIADGQNGFLGSPEELPALLKRAMAVGPADYVTMREEARSTAAHFERGHLVQRQIEIYETVLGESPTTKGARRARSQPRSVR